MGGLNSPALRKPAVIEIVPARAYLAFLNWADAAAGHVECVHVAQIHHPTWGGVKAYVKAYPPDECGLKGMVNEIAGYLVAHACDLPRSQFAFVAAVPLERLADGGPTWIRDLVDRARARRETAAYPAFCTSAIDGVSALVSLGDRDSELLRQDLLKWRDLPRALAFDDGIANVDRHGNNLLRLGKQKYALIDHGRLVAPLGNWSVDQLDSNELYTHRLLSFLYGDKEVPENISSAALMEAQRVSAAPAKIKKELQYWLERFLGPDEGRAFEAFLCERIANLERLLRRRYNLLA